MAGKTDLSEILDNLTPLLVPGQYVFCCVPGKYEDYTELSPVATFIEKEGLTLVIPQDRADQAGLGYESVFSLITLFVHSSLDAVGLTAAVTSRLTEHGISANVIAAFYHDHIFVQSDKADQAIAVLTDLADRN